MLSHDLPALLREAHVPGVSLAVVRGDDVAWADSYGLACLHPQRNVTTQTVFQAASLSKPLFAYAVLGLVERGRLDLDAPLSTYLDDPYMPDDPQSTAITTRQVLCHTTGWPNWRSRGESSVRRHAPGKVFGYSGEGYIYLQTVVEHLVGQPFEAFMQTAVLAPLDMVSSTYLWAAPDDAAVARSHDHDGRPIKPFIGDGPEAASSLHTTASDFVRFLRAMWGSTQQSTLLSGSTLHAMLQPQVSVSAALTWGLGWGLENTDLGPAFWHWGDNPGYKSMALALPARETGIVIMTNGDRGLDLCDYLVHTIIGGSHAAFDWLTKTFYDAPTL